MEEEAAGATKHVACGIDLVWCIKDVQSGTLWAFEMSSATTGR